LEIKRLPLGFFSVNCYILNLGSDCIIIDPGADAEEIKNYISQKALNPLLVLNTHGHYDHIGAVPEMLRTYNISLYIHPLEEEIITDPGRNMSQAFGDNSFSISKYTLIDDRTRPFLEGLGLQIIHTPGHTPGSICIRKDGNLFCGDLLFAQAAGRTDLPGGKVAQIKDSLNKIRKMDKNLILYPGHGPETTIEAELAANYYLSDDFLG